LLLAEEKGWVFARWRIHGQQLDAPRVSVHARRELFLLDVRLPACEWMPVRAWAY
jgi:hypothetical protein